jgi:pimeloyl-ACP methyl ester carboxylesterase
MLAADWLAAGPRWFDAAQHEALARQFLFHDCAEVPEPALRTIELLHTRHLAIEPSPMTAWPDTPSTVIVCTEDRTVRPDWLRRHARRIGANVVEMRTGHSPHACFAKELSVILSSRA